MTADTPRVAVLGLGIMGGAMAKNIVEAGMTVRGWNRNRERMQALQEHPGFTAAVTPAEAVRGADLIVTAFSDGPVTAKVMLETRALHEAPADAVWLQMGTIGVEWTQRLGEEARRAKVIYVDAPVLGTKAPAEQGALVVLASGPEAARQKVAPVLDAVGKQTLWLGETDEGSRLKLVVNHWIAGLMANLSETLSLATALQVDPSTFLRAIDGSAVGSPYAQIKGRMMLEDQLGPSFMLKLAQKDVALVLKAAKDAGHQAPLAQTVEALFRAANEQGLGELDMAALFKARRD